VAGCLDADEITVAMLPHLHRDPARQEIGAHDLCRVSQFGSRLRLKDFELRMSGRLNAEECQ